MHEFFARRAARELWQLPGVERIFVYGSVARGTHQPDSDIDLAVIVDDAYRAVPTTIDGQPQEHRSRINAMHDEWKTRYDIDLDITTYWSSQFARGIRLPRRNGYSRNPFACARELYRGLLTDLD